MISKKTKKMSKCKICLEEKPLSCFYKDSYAKNGHKSKCIPCAKQITKNWSLENLKEVRAKAREWHIKNPERSKQSAKASKMKSKYGVTICVYDKMLESQNNACAICLKPEKLIDSRTGNIRALSIDHCHKTGKVRGLLCSSCNHLLGRAKDSITTLLNAVEYLRGAA